MNHFLFGIFLPVVIALITTQVAYIVGRRLLIFFKLNLLADGILSSSANILVGYGILSYLSLILALLGPLNQIFIWLIFVVIIAADYKALWFWYGQIYGGIKNYQSFDFAGKCLLAGIVFCFIFYLTSAFVPPYRNDALAYHLPEAKEIVAHGISFPVIAGNKFFGNLPILMETLYALVFAVAGLPATGFVVINLTHYFILISAMFFIYGFARLLFNRRAALLSVLGIFTIYELFVNATNAYVDGAMLAYEVVGFCVLALGLERKNSKILFLSGIFYGLAISTKYYALYGLAVAGLLLIFYCLKQKFGVKECFRNLFLFSAAVLLACGFWYFKNLILYGNPVYPFYFGHPGFGDQEFLDAANNIKLFAVDRNWYNFITLPFHFLLSSYRLPMFLAFVCWPLFLIFYLKKSRNQNWNFILLLSAYVFLQLIIWFFFATHQVRFLFVPAVILFIFFGALLEELSVKVLRWFDYRILFVAALFLISLLGFKIVKAKNNYFLDVKKAEIFYIFGKYSEADFYDKRNLGTSYTLADYVNNNYANEKFLNVWNTNNFFVKNGNSYVSPGPLFYVESFTTSTLLDFIKKENIKYGMLDNYEKYQSFNEPVRAGSPRMMQYANFSATIEEIVKHNGHKVFDVHGGEIYQFDFTD